MVSLREKTVLMQVLRPMNVGTQTTTPLPFLATSRIVKEQSGHAKLRVLGGYFKVSPLSHVVAPHSSEPTDIFFLSFCTIEDFSDLRTEHPFRLSSS